MSIASVKLPDRDTSDYDTSSDLEPPPQPNKPKIPKKTELSKEDEEADNPFDINEDEEIVTPSKELNYESLGLPPLTFTSDPFLSPINSVQFAVKRHRIWIRGIKGVKFSLSISGYTVLVAKRKMKYLKKTWFISRSMNFSLDTPDLVGILVKQRKGVSFSLFGPQERKTDHCRPVLAAIDIEHDKRAILGKDLWVLPEEDDVFEKTLTEENSVPLRQAQHTFDVRSVKNAAFALEGSEEPCFIAAKQLDKSVVVNAKGPLSLAQAFGLAISLFMQ